MMVRYQRFASSASTTPKTTTRTGGRHFWRAHSIPLSLLFFGAASGGGGAHAETFQFDPAACNVDVHGKVYLAFGRTVLAVPYHGPMSVLEIEPGMNIEKLTPPEPQEPEGCQGNPAQLTNLGYAYEYHSRSGVERRDAVDTLIGTNDLGIQLIRTTRRASDSTAESRNWRAQEIQESIASRVCGDEAFQERLSNGLTLCRFQPTDKSAPKEDWAFTYVANPLIYHTPLGARFVANCDPGLLATSIGWCTVTYLMTPGVGITYSFNPYKKPENRRAISADELIPFDQGLRAQFEAQRVINYRWPDQKQNN